MAGFAAAILLVGYYGFAEIGGAILEAGWGVLAVVAFHPVQILLSALGWRAVLPPDERAGLPAFLRARWIREAVNALLPVAQIGGELVRVRLLGRAGMPMARAAASVVVDLTVEMLCLTAFIVIGVGLLVRHGEGAAVARELIGAIAAALGIAALFLMAQRWGLFRLVERSLVRLGERARWAALAEASGLHEALAKLYRRPKRLAFGGTYHLASYLLGGVEVLIGLAVLGVAADLPTALIIESLGQAVRALGFAVPGALGVQEGGLVLICGLLGIGPETAIELSLLKRIRELALGVPALILWQLIEGRWLAARLKASR